MILKTPRLDLRELSPSDARNFHDLNADPDVLRYTGDPPFENVEAARQFLEQYDQYEKHGYGRWAVILRSTGEFIGWCGLKYAEDLKGTDLGFRFFKKYWGKGYATEAAQACIIYGFTQLGLKKIYGRSMKANTASIRVLQKVGMRFIGEREFELHDGVLYEITGE